MFYSTAAVGAAIFAYQRLQPRLNLKESEPFIPDKALLNHPQPCDLRTAAMSCAATLNVATVTAVFSPDDTITRYGSSRL